MEASKVDGLELGELVGYGGCGRVYEVEEERVAKVFDDRAISRQLLEKMTGRLETDGWPAGVIPVISRNFEAKQPF